VMWGGAGMSMVAYAIINVADTPRIRTLGATTNSHSHQYLRRKNRRNRWRRRNIRRSPLGLVRRFGPLGPFGWPCLGRYHSAPGGWPVGVGVTRGRFPPGGLRPVLATD